MHAEQHEPVDGGGADPTISGNPAENAEPVALDPAPDPLLPADAGPPVMGNAGAPPASTSPCPPEAPVPVIPAKGQDNPIVSQELLEVRLLLDYLSGDPAHTLPDPDSATAAGLDKDWIEQVCRMTWPPSGSACSQADQEALLVRVKDYLNRRAYPASGFSVAFTLLVTQENDAPEVASAHLSRTGGVAGQSESRGSLAQKAYPGLVGKARTFRRGISAIAVFVLFCLAVTCLMSWEIALGNSLLTQFSTAQAAVNAARGRVDDLQKHMPAPNVAATPGPAADGPPATAIIATTEMAPCPVRNEIPGMVAKETLDKSADWTPECRELASSQLALAGAGNNLRGWMDFPWKSWLQAGVDRNDGAFQQAYITKSVVDLCGSAILPVFYGILGAAAAVLRLMSRRIRQSLLTPRDLMLSVQQLALGAVVGACIGLFVTAPVPGSPEQTQLIGPVGLSSSALSFIAGFGVDAVFATLEALIARIFNLSAPAAPPADKS